jgi:hypothetical protein
MSILLPSSAFRCSGVNQRGSVFGVGRQFRVESEYGGAMEDAQRLTTALLYKNPNPPLPYRSLSAPVSKRRLTEHS